MEVSSAPNANPENQGTNTQSTQATQTPKASIAKSLAELVPGQVFSAEILDIQPGNINLKIGQQSLSARTLSPPDARIGDNATFVVRDNSPGQIVLEFLRGGLEGTTSQVSASIVKEALSAANMQYTNQNSGLIESLVNHNLPIDNHSVQRAAFFKYSMPNAPFEQIAFLMENNFAPTERTVDMFQKLIEGQVNLKGELASLNQYVNESGNKELQALLSNSGNMLFDMQNEQNSQNLQLGKYLTNLRALAEEAQSLLRNSDNPIIRQNLENISDILDFARNIGETKLYYQFPFVIDNREHLAELHVFKKRAKKTSGKNATALLALNMASLGRIEIMVNKFGNDVNLQFKAAEGLATLLVGENKAKLAEMLKDKGYLLTGLSTRPLDEKFHIASSPEAVASDKAQPPLRETGKRYSFDMRV